MKLSYISSIVHVLMSCIARNPETNFSLLQSKIRELHPVHRDTLGALLRHLLRVTSHSDKAEIRWLANVFSYAVLRGSHFSEDGIRLKVRCIDLS